MTRQGGKSLSEGNLRLTTKNSTVAVVRLAKIVPSTTPSGVSTSDSADSGGSVSVGVTVSVTVGVTVGVTVSVIVSVGRLI